MSATEGIESGADLRMPAINRENLHTMRTWDTDPRIAAVKQAYLDMVSKARYRPEAPNDGFGHIMLNNDSLDDPVRLEMEAMLAGRRFYEDDERVKFTLHGCCDFRLAATMYLALQAAQLCCSGPHPSLRTILELALKALPPEAQRPPGNRRTKN